MSNNGYDWMTDARTAGEERREGVREGHIRGLLSLRFWRVYDGVRYGYGLLDRSDSLPGFDLIDAMDAAAKRETYWGVNKGMLATLTELAEQEWMTDRSTPDEWIAFFERHSLPGAEIFKREDEAESAMPVESVASEGNGPEQDVVRAVASENGKRSAQARRKRAGYYHLKELWIKKEQGMSDAEFKKHALAIFSSAKDEIWKCPPSKRTLDGWVVEWQGERDEQERLKTVANG